MCAQDYTFVYVMRFCR